MHGRDAQNDEILAQCASCGVARNRGSRCKYCGAIYPDGLDIGPTDSSPRSLDKKYTVKQQGRQIAITWSWRTPILWFLFPFFFFWNFLVISLLSISDLLSNPLSFFPVPALHIMVGLGGAYYVALYFFNTTTIEANNRSLSLTHQPIPWRGAMKFNASEIADVLVTSKSKSYKKQRWEVPILQITTNDGLQHTLLEGKSEDEFSDYQALRRHISSALGHEYH